MFATTQPPDRAFQKCKSGNRTLLLGVLQDFPEPQHSSLHLSQPEACKTGPCPSCSFLAAVHSGPCRPQAPQLTKHIPAPGPLHLISFCLGCFPPGSLHGWLVLIRLQLEYSFIREEALITLSKMSHPPITPSCFVVFRMYTIICYLLISSLIYCLLCWNENFMSWSLSAPQCFE